jgi:hypothetical protein
VNGGEATAPVTHIWRRRRGNIAEGVGKLVFVRDLKKGSGFEGRLIDSQIVAQVARAAGGGHGGVRRLRSGRGREEGRRKNASSQRGARRSRRCRGGAVRRRGRGRRRCCSRSGHGGRRLVLAARGRPGSSNGRGSTEDDRARLLAQLRGSGRRGSAGRRARVHGSGHGGAPVGGGVPDESGYSRARGGQEEEELLTRGSVAKRNRSRRHRPVVRRGRRRCRSGARGGVA